MQGEVTASGGDLAGRYQPGLVVLSVAIAILASYAALDLAGRVAAARGGGRVAWLAGGAFAMGLGIWSMHYIGMLAFSLPIAVYYHVPTIALSLLAAVFASAVALFVVSRRVLTLPRLLVGSVVMGGGIAAMHYTGMASMRMPAMVTYNRLIFTASVVIAIVVSLVAMVLAFLLRGATTRAWGWRKLGSTVIMGGAIPAMHYTGMAAAHFTSSSAPIDLSFAIPITSLGATAVASPTFLVLALAIVTSMLDRRLHAQAGDLARFRAIVESSHDAIVAIALDGTILAWNPGAERQWGYAAAETLGRPITILAPLDRPDESAMLVRRILGGERLDNYETMRRHKDGTVIEVAITFSRIRDATGQVVGMAAITRDITEQKRTEKSLRAARDAAEQAAEARSAFLANMSHEIRTPMNAILGLTELMLDTELGPEQQRHVAMVHGAAEGLLSVLNDILEFSKSQSDQLDLERIAFDLRGLVNTAMRLLAIRAAQRGLELVCDIRPDVPRVVEGDPSRLRQVLTNLLGNALKFTHDGEVALTVWLDREAADRQVVIGFSVRDTGIGIPAERLVAIFDAFSQADVSTTRQYGGTGLGLAISQRLVRLMGGELRVTSAPGTGSEFRFTMPFGVEAADSPAPAPAAEPPRLEQARTLVVDDNATNRTIMREILRLAEIATDEVDGADAAYAALRHAASEGRPYTLALVDAHMPGRDGFNLAAQVLGDPTIAGTRILMLTSGGSRGDAQRCRELGIRGYLTKPVSQSDLLDAVVAVLGGAAAEIPAVITRHSIAEARRSLRILIAEDNPVNQEVAATMLRKRGHQVDVVENGREAVEAVAARSYDVVLMDIQMPEMDGLDATRAIRATSRGQGQRIVALTAHALDTERERCMAAGMNDYLSKPFKAHELFAVVEGRATAETKPEMMPKTTPAPVDLEAFRATMRQAGAEDAVDGIVALFADEAPRRLRAVTDALAAGDVRAIERAAHAFKSAAATVGAGRLAGMLAHIEQVARAGQVDRLSDEEPRLSSEVAAILQYLSQPH